MPPEGENPNPKPDADKTPNPNPNPKADDDEGKDDDGGDATKLLKALREEREARHAAEKEVKRLTDDKEREKRRMADARRAADANAASKSGEWEEVAKARERELAEREGEIEELKKDLAQKSLDSIRVRVAMRHKLPEALVLRLVGTDEASIERDARELAKLIAPPKAPDTEAGVNGKGTSEERAKAHTEDILRKTGRYAPL